MPRVMFDKDNAVKVVSRIRNVNDLMFFKHIIKSQEDMITMREMVKAFDNGCVLGAMVKFWDHRDKKEAIGKIVGLAGKGKFRVENRTNTDCFYYEVPCKHMYAPAM